MTVVYRFLVEDQSEVVLFVSFCTAGVFEFHN